MGLLSAISNFFSPGKKAAAAPLKKPAVPKVIDVAPQKRAASDVSAPRLSKPVPTAPPVVRPKPDRPFRTTVDPFQPVWDVTESEMSQDGYKTIGQDAYGNNRIVNELNFQHQPKVVKPPSNEELTVNGVLGAMADNLRETRVDPNDPSSIETGIRRSRSNLGDVAKDVTTRVRNGRRYYFDDPNNPDDDIQNEMWYDDEPSFTADERIGVYELPSGAVVTTDEIKEIYGVEPDKEKGIEGVEPRKADEFVMVDGTVVTPAQMAKLEDLGNGLWKVMGRTYTDDELLATDRYFYVGGKDGKPAGKISQNDLTASMQDMDKYFAGYYTPDGQHLIIDKDGNETEWANHNLNTASEGHRYGLSAFDYGAQAPRPVYQDRAGNNIWDLKNFQWDEMNFGELPAWATDLALGMAPLMLPPQISIPLALVENVAYSDGVNANSYVPTSAGMRPDSIEDIWDGLKDLGAGSYSDEKMTPVQATGGYAAAIAEPLVERLTLKGFGKALGADEIYPWLPQNRFGKVASSAIKEAGEEMLTQPLYELEQSGLKNYGIPSEYNEVSGEYEPNGKEDILSRLLYLAGREAEAGADGALAGLGFNSGTAVRGLGNLGASAIDSLRYGKRATKTPPMSMSNKAIQEIMRENDRKDNFEDAEF